MESFLQMPDNGRTTAGTTCTFTHHSRLHAGQSILLSGDEQASRRESSSSGYSKQPPGYEAKFSIGPCIPEQASQIGLLIHCGPDLAAWLKYQLGPEPNALSFSPPMAAVFRQAHRCSDIAGDAGRMLVPMATRSAANFYPRADLQWLSATRLLHPR